MNKIFLLLSLSMIPHTINCSLTLSQELVKSPLSELFKAAHFGITYSLEDLLEKGGDANARNEEDGTTLLMTTIQSGHQPCTKIVLAHGAQVDAQDVNGATALYCAVQVKDLGATRLLLAHNANVNLPNNNGKTPLHVAVMVEQPELVKELLSKNATVNAQDELGNTPAHMVVTKGNYECLELLLKAGCSVNATNKRGITPLHLAALGEDSTLITLLLKYGADIYLKDSFGNSSESYCAGKEGTPCRELFNVQRDLIKLFAQAVTHGYLEQIPAQLKGRKLINVPDAQGRTPLIHAARSGSLAMLSLLLDEGADSSVRDTEKKTVLHHAAESGTPEMVTELCRRFPQLLNTQDAHGLTPIMCAAQASNERSVECLCTAGADLLLKDSRNKTVLHYAAEKGLERSVKKLALLQLIDLQCKIGNTALHYAALWGHTSCVDALLKAGANRSLTNSFTQTAFFSSCVDTKNLPCLEFFLEEGSNPDEEDGHGNRALHITAGSGFSPLVAALLKRGADHSIKDGEGNSPFFCAAQEGHTEAARLLLAYGAQMNGTHSSGKTISQLVLQGKSREFLLLLGEYSYRLFKPSTGTLEVSRSRSGSSMLQRKPDEMEGPEEAHPKKTSGGILAKADIVHLLLEHANEGKTLSADSQALLAEHLMAQWRELFEKSLTEKTCSPEMKDIIREFTFQALMKDRILAGFSAQKLAPDKKSSNKA